MNLILIFEFLKWDYDNFWRRSLLEVSDSIDYDALTRGSFRDFIDICFVPVFFLFYPLYVHCEHMWYQWGLFIHGRFFHVHFLQRDFFLDWFTHVLRLLYSNESHTHKSRNRPTKCWEISYFEANLTFNLILLTYSCPCYAKRRSM